MFRSGERQIGQIILVLAKSSLEALAWEGGNVRVCVCVFGEGGGEEDGVWKSVCMCLGEDDVYV